MGGKLEKLSFPDRAFMWADSQQTFSIVTIKEKQLNLNEQMCTGPHKKELIVISPKSIQKVPEN